ncbi:hypothetical protein P3S67_027174 [Capsicum chacoense]
MALSQLFQFACTIVLGHGNNNNSSQEKVRKLGTTSLDIHDKIAQKKKMNDFQMPLHYPRYKKGDYEKMEEWKLDTLLKQYGFFHFDGTLEEKRKFAIGAFLWPDQL